MKKNIVLIFTKILCMLFIIGTIILLWIVYKDIESNIVFKVGIGYLFLTFFLIFYLPIITILNSRRLKWIEIRKRLFKFIALFILFSTLNYIFHYVFKHGNTDLLRIFSGALGSAFGISFIDVTFLKNKEN